MALEGSTPHSEYLSPRLRTAQLISTNRAFIVSVARTAAGKRNGRIAGVHLPCSAPPSPTIVQRAGDFDPALIDDVIFGAVSQVGSQAAKLGRTSCSLLRRSL